VKSARTVARSPACNVNDSVFDSPVAGNEKTTECRPGSRSSCVGHRPRATPSTRTTVPSPNNSSSARSADTIAAAAFEFTVPIAPGGGAAAGEGFTAEGDAVASVVAGVAMDGDVMAEGDAAVIVVTGSVLAGGIREAAPLPKKNAAIASALAASAANHPQRCRRTAIASRPISTDEGAGPSPSRFGGSGATEAIFLVDTSAGGVPDSSERTSSRAANVLVPICVAIGREGGRCKTGCASVSAGNGWARTSRTRSPSRRAKSPRSTPARKRRSARASSSACCGRSLASEDIALAMTSSNDKRRMLASLGFGCAARMLASTSPVVRRRNGAFPLQSSMRSTATANTSAAAVSSPPPICSGGMCPGDPKMPWPVGVVATGAAIPKSMTLTCPSSSTITFRGVTSRCTRFMRRCA